jgi:PE family protein
MQPLAHNQEAVGVGSEVVANGVRGLALGTAAGAEVSALLPAGAEEVSLAAALAFASEGLQTLAVNALAQEELARAGAAYIEASGVYATVDGSSATVLS